MKRFHALIGILVVTLLVACGGGGGSAGTNASTTTGATTVIASSSATTSTFTTPTVANITFANFQATSASLASGANTAFSVNVLSNGLAPATPVNVQFYATCGVINGVETSAANPISVTTNGAGLAAADFSAVSATNQLCSGPVTIFANAVNATQSSIGLNVAAPLANSIQFVSASPSKIFVAGAGALERSQVTFRVFGATGAALSNVTVTVSLEINPGGVGIGSSGSTTPVIGTSNASGDVQVDVFSGTNPGPVKVKASLSSNAAVFAESQNLTVASGPPSQRFMSLSVEKFNIEGWAVDGSATKLTVRIADRQGNSVQDGTVVNFTAEGGQVASSCATSTSGGISSCSVDFISQNPRTAGGRVSILAYLEGTKDFVDNDGNNQFSVGDTLNEIGNAYRDDNEDGIFNTGEFRINRGGALACAGVSGTFPAQANTCDGLAGTTVRQQVAILFSSSSPVLTSVNINAGFISAIVRSADNTLLPMPVGTTISAEVSGGTCAVNKQFGSPVVNVSPGTNPTADLATAYTATFSNCVPGDIAFINVQSPGGLRTTFGPYVIP
jgi:hypothetical protein